VERRESITEFQETKNSKKVGKNVMIIGRLHVAGVV